MHGSSYWDSSDILAEDTLAPIKFHTGIRGCASRLDQSSASSDVKEGAQVELPLWLTTTLAERNIVDLRTPRFYSQKVMRKISAGPGCEGLRVRCAYFYDVACKIYQISGSVELATFANETFRARFMELLVKTQSTSQERITQVQSLLSAEELAIFEAGRCSMDRFDRWIRTGNSSAPRPRRRLEGIAPSRNTRPRL